MSSKLELFPKSCNANQTESAIHLLYQAKEKLKDNIIKIKPDFGVTLHGSCVYGLNPEHYGNLNDIDGIIVLPDNFDPGKIASQVTQIFDADSSSQFQHELLFLDKDADLVRLHGKINGAQISLYALRKQTYQHFFDFTKKRQFYRTVFPDHKKYITKLFVSRNIWGKDHDYTHVCWQPELGYLTLLELNCAQSKYDSISFGTLADKIIPSEIIYDPFEKELIRLHVRHWRTFVRIVKYHNPACTAEDILNILIRNERFSPDYRQETLQLISEELQRLNDQLEKIPNPINLIRQLTVIPEIKDEQQPPLEKTEIEKLPHLHHNPQIHFDYGHETIYKFIKGWKPSEIAAHYLFLHQIGLAIGSPPSFYQNFEYYTVPLISSSDGCNYLSAITDQTPKIIEFYKNVILTSIQTVVNAQPTLLEHSFDPIPHNFMLDKSIWVYVDYDPVSRKLTPNDRRLKVEKLVEYAFVKMVRETPWLIDELFQATLELSQNHFAFASNEIARRYQIAISQKDPDKINNQFTISNDKEERIMRKILEGLNLGKTPVEIRESSFAL